MAFLDENGLTTLWSLACEKIDDIKKYEWKRRTATVKSEIIETPLEEKIICAKMNSYETVTIYYADTYTFDNHSFTLVNPSSVPVGYDSYTNLTSARNKYVIIGASSGTVMYKFLQNMSVSRDQYTESDGITTIFYTRVKNIVQYEVKKWTEYGEWETVTSLDMSEYPSSGIVDGYEYIFVGMAFAKIATGSYIGTGTYGSANRNSLTFDFEPKLVLLAKYYVSGSANTPTSTKNWLLFTQTALLTAASDNNNLGYICYLPAPNWGNTLVWFATTVEGQGNASGATYHYIAIG